MRNLARRIAVLAGIAVVSVGITTTVATPAQASTQASHVHPTRADTSWPY